MFRGDAFGALLARLAPRYDRIVIDTAPVLAVGDAQALARFTDQVLFVVRWRQTSRYAARAGVKALLEVGAPVAGVILNAVDVKRQSLYARDDSLAYYGAYKDYYARA
jgi:Mrp family chromosome partitioning ATPase